MKRLWFIMMSLVLVAGTGFGCASKTEEKPLLQFAYFGIASHRDLFIAQEKGFFEANGVNVELVKLSSTDIVPAIVGGSVDGGMAGPITVLTAVAQGADIKFVASGARYERPEQLGYISVLNDSPIETIQELDGKTIAGHLKGSIVWIWVQVAAEESDIEFSQYVGAPAGQFQPMLIAGTVDSAVLFPNDRLIKFKDEVRGILPLTAAANFGTYSYWFSGQFIQEHPEAVRGFIAALQQAREYDRDHPIEALQLTADYVYDTFEALKNQLEANILKGFPLEMLAEVWQLKNEHDAMLDLEILDEPLNIEKWIDDGFAKPMWEMPEGELDWLP